MRFRSFGWAVLVLLGSVSARADHVVISQIYGGGGNSGSVLKNDFIELLNASHAAVDLIGFSVQYTSTTGTGVWQVTDLSPVTLQPGQYYLIQESAGGGGVADLPAVDATGSINLSATAGKVALVDGVSALTGSNPTNSSIVDLVGYGSGTDFFEGGGPAPTLSNTLSAQRLDGGLMDTDNNNLDFTTGSPNPRNTVSPFNPPPSVPEPSSMALLGTAMAGLWVMRRRLARAAA